MLLLSAMAAGNAYAASPIPVAGAMIAQQNGTCTGVVKDAAGETIIGASVVVKGTTNGTITGLDGDFSLSNVKKGSVIQISFVGYLTQEVTWNGQPLTVTLKDDTQTLEEVVVVGYGVQKKVNVTGAVSMVGEETLKARPVANVSQALQGAVPGLNLSVNSNGGMLDNTMNINIRGTGSINGSDNPLILIDGIEGDLNTLNPNDIESVSVLKDAASASIYGSRAAFGVILITTKSGKEGKVKVSYTGEVRFSTATQLPDMVNSLQFAEYWNTASKNSGGSNQFSDETMEKMKNFFEGKYTDPTKEEYYGASHSGNNWNNYTGSFANTNWFDEFYKKNVPSTQHNLSISGGTEKINYMVSGSFLINNGLMRHGHDELDRYNMTSKISGKLADWARFEYSTRWVRQDYEKPQYLSGLFFHNIARRWPTCYPIDPNGHWADGMEIAELEEGGIYTSDKDEFTQKLRFTFTPIKGWNITAEGAMRTLNQKSTTSEIPVYHYRVDGSMYKRNSGYSTETYYSDDRYRENYYAINVFTDYSLSLQEKHNFKALVGLNYEKFENDDMWASGTNLTVSTMPYLSQALSNKKNSDSYYHRAVAGYFGRLNYDYEGKYLAEFNIRYDGSSRFLADKRWAWFPSVSLGWNIAKETFFEKLAKDISSLKLRASWGQLGNTSAEYSSFSHWYPFYQQQAIGAANSSWLINGERNNTASLPGIINTQLTWETVETYDLGFDFTALNGRLTGTFDWYTRTTKDMVGPAPVLGSVLGTNSPNTNNVDMRTNGWELEIGWKDRIGKLGYNVNFNLSDSKSKILKYPYDGDFNNQSYSGYYNGKELNEIWGYTTHGIANTEAEMNSWLEKNKPNWGSNWGAGDIMYADLNDDGIVNSGAGTLGDHGDLKVIGNTTPRYRMGIKLGLDYMGFDFSAFFQGVLKRDWAFGSGDPYFWGATGNMWQSACFKEHLDYWREDNQNAYYPKPYLAGGITKNQAVQTRYLQSAAYMRIKNMQLGYSIPTSLLGKAGISSCRVYVSVDNLLTISGMSNVFDPEAMSGGWGSGKLYPLQRTWSVGLSLNF